MSHPIVSLSNVDKVYRTDRMETVALQAVSLAIEPGEFVSIMGPSGCGKSTLLNVLGLIDEPTGGEVAFGGKPVNRAVARSAQGVLHLHRLDDEERLALGHLIALFYEDLDHHPRHGQRDLALGLLVEGRTA